MRALEAYRFWAWFSDNHSRYLQPRQLDSKAIELLCVELNMELEKYCAGLSAEFPLHENGENELIITASGYEQYFDRAEDLVFMAPKLKEWNITALRPSQWDFPITLEYEGLHLSSDQLWFAPLESREEPHLFGIEVYFKDYDPTKENVYFAAASKMIDTILGEKASTLDVQYLQVGQLPEKYNAYTILELEDLTAYIEMWKEQVMMN